jgi:hypothetical protein
VPYSTSANVWPHPELITISFEPDGTNLGGQTSNLFATFNARFGSAANWENVILKAAQTWAAQTNINFAVVADNGAASGAGSYQQGDPAMGDIRIGGYNFNNSKILALGYMPPPVNNYSIAGDIGFNTGQPYHLNTTYDLYTVALHEFGHALGLDHSSSRSAAMYSTYQSVDSGLGADDIAGIRSIYSNGAPRSSDPYNSGGASNSSFSTAADVTPSIEDQAAVLTGLNLTTAGQAEYFAFTAPVGGTGSLTLTVQSQGLSLLSPSISVYNAGQTQLASISGAGHYGTTLTVHLTGIAAGQTYFVRVSGADTSAFGTGAYAMTLNFGNGSSPSVPLPYTTTPNGNPLNGGGGLADRKDSNGLSVISLLDGLLGILGLQIDLPFVDAMTPDPRFLTHASTASEGGNLFVAFAEAEAPSIQSVAGIGWSAPQAPVFAGQRSAVQNRTALAPMTGTPSVQQLGARSERHADHVVAPDFANASAERDPDNTSSQTIKDESEQEPASSESTDSRSRRGDDSWAQGCEALFSRSVDRIQSTTPSSATPEARSTYGTENLMAAVSLGVALANNESRKRRRESNNGFKSR